MLPLRISPRNGVAEVQASPCMGLPVRLTSAAWHSLWPVQALLPDCKIPFRGSSSSHCRPFSGSDCGWRRLLCTDKLCYALSGHNVQGHSGPGPEPGTEGAEERTNPSSPARPVHGCAPGPVHATGRLSISRQQVRKQGETGAAERQSGESVPSQKPVSGGRQHRCSLGRHWFVPKVHPVACSRV